MTLWMPNKKKPLYAPMLATFGGGSVRGFRGAPAGGGTPLFSMAVGTSWTLRPITFGAYGSSQSRWETVFNTVNPSFWANKEAGVAQSDVLSFVTNAEENSRGNPQAGKIFGVTGWPSGTYRFTLRGGGGGSADPGYGAPGGLGVGDISLTPADVVWFAVGQGGMFTGGADRNNFGSTYWWPNAGGWNGGGAAGAQNSNSMYSGSGGGGTDIRLNGYALSDRVFVAGGGGGATDQNYNTGGQGGGPNQDGQRGGVTTHNNTSYTGQGGTLSAGGSGALYQGTLYDTAMNGSLWAGGIGYDGSQPVNSANAAGGGGGGYYGGGGAVDEDANNGGGAGGGSGYADTSVVSNITASLGGANNGHQSYSFESSSVDALGRSTAGFTLYNGTNYISSASSSDNTQFQNYVNNGTETYINQRYGDNGSIAVQRIS